MCSTLTILLTIYTSAVWKKMYTGGTHHYDRENKVQGYSKLKYAPYREEGEILGPKVWLPKT